MLAKDWNNIDNPVTLTISAAAGASKKSADKGAIRKISAVIATPLRIMKVQAASR